MPRKQSNKKRSNRPSNSTKGTVRSNSRSRKVEDSPADSSKEEFDTKRNNDPRWYYFDEKIADQVSQLSFQNLAGYPIEYDNFSFDVPNIVRIHLNPSPGVQTSSVYNTPLAQNSAINMSGFRLYSKLSSFTGRTQNYAPQDVSTMILAFGELISMIGYIRRAFGVAYTMNIRNRAYPVQILEFGMLIDATDLFTHLSNYRIQFNTLLTLVNQLPIPKNVAYFDKCASLYEKIYLDSPSSMAQTLITVPHTTWTLDEQSYSGGSILSTTQVCSNAAANDFLFANSKQPMSFYLNTLAGMIGALLNSSTLNIVYADILNYATKVGTEFWKPDYLLEGYMVVPEYSENFMLQMHNATIAYMPYEPTFVTGAANVTPYNDVYPDPNRNALFYNPAFPNIGTSPTGHARTGDEVLIDMLNDNPSLTDRIEVTRYSSCTKGTPYTTTRTPVEYAFIDAAVPDHYIVMVYFQTLTSNLTFNYAHSTVLPTNIFQDVSSLVANIDWAPRIYETKSDYLTYTGRYTGDVNFYTTVDMAYLRKLHDFVGLALYDVRS